MTTAEIAASPLSDIDHRRQLRRAVIASTIGTTIEWYDFLLYNIVTGLVFAKLYFPQSDPLIGTMQAYAIFFVGFIARPVGAFIFGHYGDRIGRKAALIATLLLTGLATFAVALVPSYEQIGIWGAIIMLLLRFIQGIGVGGEWGGSVLLSMEWARTNANRGFIASWPQIGGPCGLALANLAVLVFSKISGDQFLTWGWRIPFLLSIIMVGIGLYIRLGIFETPVFARIVAEDRVERAPSIEVIKRQPKEIILTAFARMAEQAPAYIYIAYIFTYGTAVLGASRDFLLVGVLTTSILGFLWVPIAGHLSDRIGRKRMYMIGAAISGLFGFVYFALLDTRVGRLDVCRYRAVVSPEHESVRPAGGADRGVFRAAPALQRCRARLPAGLDHRRRSRAVHRGGIVRRLSFGLRDCFLHPGLRRHQHCRHGAAQGLHEQGHFRGTPIESDLLGRQPHGISIEKSEGTWHRVMPKKEKTHSSASVSGSPRGARNGSPMPGSLR